MVTITEMELRLVLHYDITTCISITKSQPFQMSVHFVNHPITFKFTYIFYPWGQFDPSNLNLQKMIIIKKCAQVYVSGTLCLFVDYLNSPLNKTIPPPLYIQNTCYVTMEKYADHHKISVIDLNLERDILFVRSVLCPCPVS